MRKLAWSLVAVLGLAWLAAWVVPYDVVADVNPARASLRPGSEALLGTDHLGRSVAMRLLVAVRAFAGPGILAALVAGFGGAALGAAAAWAGRRTEALVLYGLTVLASIPRLVLILLSCTIFGASQLVLALATGLACVPEAATTLHARITALKRSEFVLAARAHGIPPGRILWFHLVWVNGRGPLLRQVVEAFAFFLVTETTLSYLGGFGVQEPTPSWGNMLAFEFGIVDGNPWAALAPALTLGLVLLGLATLSREPAHG